MRMAFEREFSGQPLFPKDSLAGLKDASHLLLRFGSRIFTKETNADTPLRRPDQLSNPPLDMDADYLALAVACQLVLHMPEKVSGVHSFKQPYGGRLISDIIPEVDHTKFDGQCLGFFHARIC